ncbi:alpha/beta hydrolase [Planctomicrobium sp. SH661]|uniref:alpha/beta hydrolase n=1 Tax=Planctomicrobium sp. SH661 TaxID=3448124 RepID=UPI003F5C21A5
MRKDLIVVGALLWISLLAQAARAEGPVITPDVVYGHKAGMALTYDVIRPEKPNGAGILFMVSGGWVSTWFPPEHLVGNAGQNPSPFNLLVDRGYTVFVVRHGSSPYFKVPDAVADVRRAVRFIRMHAADYGIDPNRLGVFGASAGGHLSLMLGTAADDGLPESNDPVEHASDRVQAVVAIFPPTKIDEFFKLKDQFPALAFPEHQAAEVSPLLHVSRDDAPTLLVHGDKDDLVPLSNSERIAAEFHKAEVPTELIVIPGAAHGFQGQDQIRCQNAMLDWFDKYLKKAE